MHNMRSMIVKSVLAAMTGLVIGSSTVAFAIDCMGDACKDIRFRIIRVSDPDDFNKVQIRNNNRGKSVEVCYGTTEFGLSCFSGGSVHCAEIWESETSTFDMPFGHRGVCPPITANYLSNP